MSVAGRAAPADHPQRGRHPRHPARGDPRRRASSPCSCSTWSPSAAHRGWLAGFSLVAVAASFGATVWGWFDAATPHTVYFGSFAYDRFGLFVNAIILVSTALVLMISPQYLNRRGLHYGEYYSLILAAATGMMLLAGASSLMVIFLAIELLSIALYILSGFSRQEPRSQEAALKYLLLGGFASGFLLFGMALIYGETGHTQLAQIAAALQSAGTTRGPAAHGGRRAAVRRAGLQDQRRAVPHLDAGRVPGRADLGDHVHERHHQGGRVRRADPRLHLHARRDHRVRPLEDHGVLRGHRLDGDRQRGGAAPDQPQAHARLLGHRPGGLHPHRRGGAARHRAGSGDPLARSRRCTTSPPTR